LSDPVTALQDFIENMSKYRAASNPGNGIFALDGQSEDMSEYLYV